MTMEELYVSKDVRYYKDKEKTILHREDGPAVECSNGTKEWRFNGKPHREDGPAIERANGDKIWCFDGNLHRDDGPAIEWVTGHKEWYFHGKLHRKDGPAIERVNGTKEWHLNGKLHRKDGPAIEYADGGKEWWLNGKKLTKEEFEMRNLHIVKNSEGTCYYKDPEHKILHRENGPAIERVNGHKEWWLNGKQYQMVKT